MHTTHVLPSSLRTSSAVFCQRADERKARASLLAYLLGFGGIEQEPSACTFPHLLQVMSIGPPDCFLEGTEKEVEKENRAHVEIKKPPLRTARVNFDNRTIQRMAAVFSVVSVFLVFLVGRVQNGRNSRKRPFRSKTVFSVVSVVLVGRFQKGRFGQKENGLRGTSDSKLL